MPEEEDLDDVELEPVRRRRSWVWVLSLLLVLLAFLLFPRHIIRSTGWLVSIPLAWFGVDTPPLSTELLTSIKVTAFNCACAIVPLFILWVFVLSRSSVVPVKTFSQGYRLAFYQFQRLLRLHRSPAFIKNGSAWEPPEVPHRSTWLRRLLMGDPVFTAPGVMVVDFNSAAVLEDNLHLHNPLRPMYDLLMYILTALGLKDDYRTPRVLPAGVYFPRPSERIRATVDLRRQLRIRPDVRAYTRDGIELSTNVWTLFTIGQETETVDVTYVGSPRAENLRVVTLEEQPDKRWWVRKLSNDLDPEDRVQIHTFGRVARQLGGAPYQVLPAEPQPAIPRFDEGRVFAAVFSEARSHESQLVPWTDLPPLVAIDLLREMLAHVNYDEFYRVEEVQSGETIPSRPPLRDFQQQFRARMRSQGLLSYRLVLLSPDATFEEGHAYEASQLTAFTPTTLTAPKVLRNRSIRVISSGFGDFIPPPAVYQQRLNSWQATWQADTEILHAESELEAQRVRIRARAQAQQDMVHSLSRIFQAGRHPQEVLAVRVFQALENLAVDPGVRQLLPADTISLMRTIHEWILPNGGVSMNKPPSPPPAAGGTP